MRRSNWPRPRALITNPVKTFARRRAARPATRTTRAAWVRRAWPCIRCAGNVRHSSAAGSPTCHGRTDRSGGKTRSHNDDSSLSSSGVAGTSVVDPPLLPRSSNFASVRRWAQSATAGKSATTPSAPSGRAGE